MRHHTSMCCTPSLKWKSIFAPGVVPAAAWRVSAVSVQPGFRPAVTFVDGTSGIADLSRLVAGNNAGVFAAIAAPDFFAQARLELGVLTWPNGADLDPDWLLSEKEILHEHHLDRTRESQ